MKLRNQLLRYFDNDSYLPDLPPLLKSDIITSKEWTSDR
jgi:hypothetical protein